ncbi:hypothetical protein EDB89DRAFT_1931273, partial [Lactarius sanguifluus]
WSTAQSRGVAGCCWCRRSCRQSCGRHVPSAEMENGGRRVGEKEMAAPCAALVEIEIRESVGLPPVRMDVPCKVGGYGIHAYPGSKVLMKPSRPSCALSRCVRFWRWPRWRTAACTRKRFMEYLQGFMVYGLKPASRAWKFGFHGVLDGLGLTRMVRQCWRM